jgi:3'(2'), 5'-bisphosphate nucleotidase
MKSDLLLISRTAVAAGRAILRIYQTDFSVEEKSDGSPLTQADRAAHSTIRDGLANTGIPLLSEEGRDIDYAQRKNWPVFWLIDPLDGTKEFIHRRGEFTVNIARIENGRPVMGVVYLPAARTLYFAARGVGAWRLDAERMSAFEAVAAEDSGDSAWSEVVAAAERLPLSGTGGRAYTIIGSRSHGSEAVEAFVEKRREEHGKVEFISAGSSLKFCRVAEGAADVYPRFGPTMEWDTAAGQAVAEAAGAAVVDAETGRPLIYNKPDLHNPHFIVRRT